jgi:2'-5' RNA ligase
METMSMTVLTRAQFASAAGTGAMVALIPTAPDALAAEGGDPADELHITMLYLGDADEFSPKQQQAVHETATLIAGMVGREVATKVGGIAEFGPDGDGDIAIVAVLESPIVGPMRDVLEEAMLAVGVENASTHPGFIPHMTVGYAPPDSPELDAFRDHARSLVGSEVVFDRLRVVFGGDQQDHPLGSPHLMTDDLDEAVSVAVAAGEMDDTEAATLYRTARGRWTHPENHNGADPAHNDSELVPASDGATMTTIDTNTSNGPWSDTTVSVSTTFAVDVVEPETVAAEANMEIGDVDENGMVPWHGIIVVEGVPSGDFRTIAPGALSWRDLPLPMMSMLRNPDGGTGHDGAELAGRVDTIERLGHDDERFTAFAAQAPKRAVEIVYATGVFDPASPGGPDTISAFRNKLMRGVSVDLDSVERLDAFAADGKTPDMQIVHGRIIGLTATPFQAFAEATIELGLVASGAESEGQTATIWTPFAADALVASAAPIAPPAEWFAKQSLTPGAPITINGGQISGYVAKHGSCHISFGNRCIPVPRSRTNYAGFRNGTVITAEGTPVRTGPIIMDTVHPDLRKKASDAQAFYAHTGCAIADVVPYEDEYGIQIAGALRPDVDPVRVRAFLASDVSPDWRTWNGSPMECVAMLAVNTSGFKHDSRAASAGEAGEYPVDPGDGSVWLDPDGQPLAMVAAGALVLDDADVAVIEGESPEGRQARLDAVVARFSLERKARVAAAMERFALAAPRTGITFVRPR